MSMMSNIKEYVRAYVLGVMTGAVYLGTDRWCEGMDRGTEPLMPEWYSVCYAVFSPRRCIRSAILVSRVQMMPNRAEKWLLRMDAKLRASWLSCVWPSPVARGRGAVRR